MPSNFVTSLVSTLRKTNTASGNPQWKLFTTDGTFHTKPDAAVGHEIKDQFGSTTPRPVRIQLSGQGTVIGIEYLEGDL